MFLTDLADACRKSGLKVVEVPGWRTRGRPASTGGFAPRGVLNHHTGAKDVNPNSIEDDAEYAEWLAEIGRSDLPAPLCQVSLGHGCVVYVCAAGRGNHAGEARATGPMPAGDGNELYLGIEHQNNGTEGWDSTGIDAAGNEITQYDAAVRLNAALDAHYGWPADHSRGHKETSLTGKWDPGAMDMDQLRADVAAAMEEDDMAKYDEQLDTIQAGVEKTNRMLDNLRTRQLAQTTRLRKRLDQALATGKATREDLEDMRDAVDELAAAVTDDEG